MLLSSLRNLHHVFGGGGGDDRRYVIADVDWAGWMDPAALDVSNSER